LMSKSRFLMNAKLVAEHAESLSNEKVLILESNGIVRKAVNASRRVFVSVETC
jgi:hypothetical protein